MLLHDKFIALVEGHADQLTRNWIREVKTNPLTPSYKDLNEEDLHFRVFDVYKRLGLWLPQDETHISEIAEHYLKLGRSRALEGVKLSEVIYAVTLSRKVLWGYVRSQGIINDSIDMYRALEFYQRVNSFFDKVIYFVVTGFESASIEDQEVFKESGLFDKVIHNFAHWMMKDLR